MKHIYSTILPLLTVAIIAEIVIYLRERVRRPLVVACDGGEGQWIDQIEERITK